MAYRVGKKDPRGDDHLAPGPCPTMSSFPEDDGRPCRENADGVNEFVLPKSFQNGSVRKLDYVRLACEYARDEGGLDILLITPHSKNGGEDGEADTTEKSFLERQAELKKLHQEFRGRFYCGLGQEVSSISRGNHVNVMGHFRNEADSVVPPIFFKPGEFADFYRIVQTRNRGGEKVLLQFNHPDVSYDLYWRPFDLNGLSEKQKRELQDDLNDYGLDDFAPLACHTPWVKQRPETCAQPADEVKQLDLKILRETYRNIRASGGDAYRLIEIVSPKGATTNAGTLFRRAHQRADSRGRNQPIEEGLLAYIYFLYMGFRVSPTANQDNHFINFGAANASRTGVFAKSLNEDDVYAALDQGLTFATEDRNARVLLIAKSESESALMGTSIRTAGETIRLRIAYSDADTEDPVDVRVYSYHQDDELDFRPKSQPQGSVRSLRFTEFGARLPDPDEPAQDLKAALRSGDVREIEIPVKPGRSHLFVEITQPDLDKIWSAPVYVESSASK